MNAARLKNRIMGKAERNRVSDGSLSNEAAAELWDIQIDCELLGEAAPTDLSCSAVTD